MDSPAEFSPSVRGRAPTGPAPSGRAIPGIVVAVAPGQDGGSRLTVDTALGRMEMRVRGRFSEGENVRLDLHQGRILRILRGQDGAAPSLSARAEGVPILRMSLLLALQGRLVQWLSARAYGAAPGSQPPPEAPGGFPAAPGGSPGAAGHSALAADAWSRLPLAELLEKAAAFPQGRQFLISEVARLLEAWGLGNGRFGKMELPHEPGAMARAVLQYLLGALRQNGSRSAESALGPAYGLDGLVGAPARLAQVLQRAAAGLPDGVAAGAASLPGAPGSARAAEAGKAGPGPARAGVVPAQTGQAPAQPGVSPAQAGATIARPGASPVQASASRPPVESVPTSNAQGPPEAASAAPPAGSPAGAGTAASRQLFRYLLDLGGQEVSVVSSQKRDRGDYVLARLEAGAGATMARFLPPERVLHAGVARALGEAGVRPHPAFAAAQELLGEFRGEPYYPAMVRDFGRMLVQGGRFEPPAAGASPAGPPSQREMEALLRLFLSFPRDAESPRMQAAAWARGSEDSALLELLARLRPVRDPALLEPGLGLKAGTPDAGPSTAARTAAEQALPERLPERFTPERLQDKLLEESARLPREAAARRFLQEALAGRLAQAGEFAEGHPQQAFAWHQTQWRGLKVLWRREGPGGKGNGGEGSFSFAVETATRRLGRVSVNVRMAPAGAHLDFRNEAGEVRDLLAEALAGLAASLAPLDFRLLSWTYGRLLPESSPDGDAGHASEPSRRLDILA